MNIQKDYSLRELNTFGMDVRAKYFVEINTVQDIRQLFLMKDYLDMEYLVLGGGSNVLLTKDVDGIVLKMNILGKEVVQEDEDCVYVKAGAGENWHEFVLYCIEHGFAGVENLSLIPGSVGAAPMQNIGAYGVELKDTFHELEAIDIVTGEQKTFGLSECEFGYRSSIFKKELKNKVIITSVTFKLNKKPVFQTTYGDIEKELEAMGVKELSVKAISDAVVSIRKRKLPDPKKIGNAGSFFKNPVIANDLFAELKKKHESIVGYPSGDTETKVAAGWLIEQAGWKGKRVGNVGVHDKQALVLVNYGGGTGKDVYELSQAIIDSVEDMFDITLEREVNIV